MTPQAKATELIEKLQKYEGTAFSEHGKLKERAKTLVLCMDVCDIILEEYANQYTSSEIFWHQVKEVLKTSEL